MSDVFILFDYIVDNAAVCLNCTLICNIYHAIILTSEVDGLHIHVVLM